MLNMDWGDIGQNDKRQFPFKWIWNFLASCEVLLSETREARASRWQQKHLVVVGTHGEYIPLPPPRHHDPATLFHCFRPMGFPLRVFSPANLSPGGGKFPLSSERKVSHFPLGGGWIAQPGMTRSFSDFFLQGPWLQACKWGWKAWGIFIFGLGSLAWYTVILVYK